jgi:hypothetical protein
MCNSNKTVSLQTAVLMVVREFAKNNKPFSIYEITREVRTRAFNGELDIPEAKVNGSSSRYDIPHTKIKDLFDDMWLTGVFDPEFTLSRQFVTVNSVSYFLYTPTLVNNVSTATMPSLPPTVNTPSVINPPFAPGYTPSVNTPTVTPTTLPFVKPSKQDITARVELYLDNCATRNFRPTLKQVQSAIKRDKSTGWTCEELQEIIEVDLGYDVVASPDYLSASQVAVV